MPTMSAVGVARPSAQGHATTITAIAGKRDCVSRVFAPAGGTKKHQMQNVMSDIPKMHGTKTDAILSAKRCTGAFDPCASSTARTMRASVESLPTRSARTVMAPVVFTVPPVTLSPGCFITGNASPVSMDSSISVDPSITSPSTATFSPGPTSTLSPTTTWASGISTTAPPRCTCAVGGVRLMSASIA